LSATPYALVAAIAPLPFGLRRTKETRMATIPRNRVVAFAAVIAVIFGVATVAAGIRVLTGSDPGYTVFRPLLLFNTVMGFAYIAVGVLAWKRSRLGTRGAGLIALVNLMALGGIAWLYAADQPVAMTSLQAMAFRTVVWAALFFVLFWAGHQARSEGREAL
jgi:hypothetical protein